MNLPTLTVVVPNFNHARALPACLRALLAQSVPALEVIVIDDASTDDSVSVIEDFARRHPSIRVLRQETNRGVVAGMNRGLELARGDFVLFAAADDEVLPGLFEKSLNLLAQHPGAGLCCAIGDWRQPERGLRWHMGVGMAGTRCFLPPAAVAGLERAGRLFIASHTVLFHRERLLAAGGFPPELKWHCDWFAMHVLAFRHGLCHVPEPLGILNIRGASYHEHGRRNAAEYRELLGRLLDRLASESCADVRAPIRDSGALFLFGWPMLRLVVSDPRGREFLTPRLARRCVWHAVRLVAKRFTPAWLGNLYFRLAGYHVPQTGAPPR
jgi:glycosyltransferase involved in cell wall biosynthesis